MFTRLAVRDDTHFIASVAARNRGMKMCDFVGEAVKRYAEQPEPVNPLHDFLRCVLDADHVGLMLVSEPGERGFVLTEEALAQQPREVRVSVDEMWRLPDGRIEVTLCSKEWAMRVAAEEVFRR